MKDLAIYIVMAALISLMCQMCLTAWDKEADYQERVNREYAKGLRK